MGSGRGPERAPRAGAPATCRHGRRGLRALRRRDRAAERSRLALPPMADDLRADCAATSAGGPSPPHLGNPGPAHPVGDGQERRGADSRRRGPPAAGRRALGAVWRRRALRARARRAPSFSAASVRRAVAASLPPSPRCRCRPRHWPSCAHRGACPAIPAARSARWNSRSRTSGSRAVSRERAVARTARRIVPRTRRGLRLRRLEYVPGVTVSAAPGRDGRRTSASPAGPPPTARSSSRATVASGRLEGRRIHTRLPVRRCRPGRHGAPRRYHRGLPLRSSSAPAGPFTTRCRGGPPTARPGCGRSRPSLARMWLDVGLDRLLGDAELERDPLVRAPARDQREHLALARRQRCASGRRRPPSAISSSSRAATAGDSGPWPAATARMPATSSAGSASLSR